MNGSNELDREKFAELILYVIDRVENPANLGPVKLQKIIWLADTLLFATESRSIAGASYVRTPQGAACPFFEEIIAQLEKARALVERTKPFGTPIQRQFFALRSPDFSKLLSIEIAAIERAIERLLPLSPMDAIKFSQTSFWESYQDGEIMRLDLAPFDTLKDGSTLLGDVPAGPTADDIAWANSAVDDDDLREAAEFLEQMAAERRRGATPSAAIA